MKLNGVILAGSRDVHVFVHPSRNVRLCTTNKQLDLELLIFAYVCKLTIKNSMLIFIQIVNVLDLHFQGQRFEARILGSSYVITLQMVTERTNIAIANK